MNRLIKWSLVGIAAVAIAVGGVWYYHHSLRYPSTDDAYIKANVIRVAAQVGGRAVSVPVSNHQSVTRGQLLFAIQSDQYDYRYRQAAAALALAYQQVAADEASVKAAEAAVTDAEAQLDNAQLHYHRTQQLAQRKMASTADLDDTRAQKKSAAAGLALAKARLTEAQRQLGQPGKHNQRVRQARAALRLAALDVAHTRVRAPCTGTLSQVNLLRGDMVSAGEPQFALVCNRRYWVYANYKENDLARIRPGQIAMVKVDMYPDHPFHGVVESINPASGTAFSLLPPQNATGNWVKVTQRVPVRILIIDASPAYPLRVQTSAAVTIDTGTGEQPLGRARNSALSNHEAEQLAREQGLAEPSKH